MAASTVKSYLVFLGADLTTPAQIQAIAGLDEPPLERSVESVMENDDEAVEEEEEDEDMNGTDEENPEESDDKEQEGENSASQTCCLVSQSTINAILEWTHTFPQKKIKLVIPIMHTPSSNTTNALRTYPIPYFLYGTLSSPQFLRDKLFLKELPVLKSAVVKQYRLRRWGTYQALILGVKEDVDVIKGLEYVTEEAEDVVHGVVYMVREEAELERMAEWMGNRYEVCRVEIFVEDGEGVEGCTFAFCGEESELRV